MGKTIKIVLGILLLIVMAAIVSFYEFTRYDESSLTSNYNFRITLTTDSKLENPTFIVPIPSGNEALVNMAINESVRDFFKPAQNSEGWNISMIETEYGRMFKISAKEFVPQVHTNVELNPENNLPTGNNFSFTTGNKEVSVSMATDHIIDTINATENEPLLSQKFNMTLSNNGEGPPSYISQKTLSYDSIIYADYTSSPDAVVEVFVDLNGVNEWWAGGSGFNSYHDRLGTTFNGEKHGWYSVTGELSEGEGFKSIPN